jgi:hypothetical protein
MFISFFGHLARIKWMEYNNLLNIVFKWNQSITNKWIPSNDTPIFILLFMSSDIKVGSLVSGPEINVLELSPEGQSCHYISFLGDPIM